MNHSQEKVIASFTAQLIRGLVESKTEIDNALRVLGGIMLCNLPAEALYEKISNPESSTDWSGAFTYTLAASMKDDVDVKHELIKMIAQYQDSRSNGGDVVSNAIQAVMNQIGVKNLEIMVALVNETKEKEKP